MKIAELKERVDMLTVLGWLGVRPHRRYLMHCPVHPEKTPSCQIYPTAYHCFGCGAHHDILDAVMHFKGVRLTEARHWIEDHIGAAPAAPIRPIMAERRLHDFTDALERQGKDRQRVREMIDARYPGLFTPEDLFGYGCRTNREHLLIPMFDHRRVVRGVKTRRLDGTGRKGSWPGSTYGWLYKPTHPHKAVGRAAIVEGESDAWALTKARPDLCVYGLPQGAGGWKEEWRDEVRDHKMVLVMTDMDNPGQAIARRIIESLDPARAVRVSLPANDVCASLLEGWKVPV